MFLPVVCPSCLVIAAVDSAERIALASFTGQCAARAIGAAFAVPRNHVQTNGGMKLEGCSYGGVCLDRIDVGVFHQLGQSRSVLCGSLGE